MLQVATRAISVSLISGVPYFKAKARGSERNAPGINDKKKGGLKIQMEYFCCSSNLFSIIRGITEVF